MKSDYSKNFIDHKFDKDVNRMYLNTLYSSLSSFLNISIEKIAEDYWDRKSNEDKAEQERVAGAKREEDVLEYYKKTQQYLYELVCEESVLKKQLLFEIIYRFCKKNKINRVLDFGGGIGGLCIYLANRKISCEYIDVDGAASRFARWRFEKEKLNIPLLYVPNLPSAKRYDLVVALEVLEHLFDIESTLNDINSCLKKNGYFINISTFLGGGVHLPQNEVYADIIKFNDLMSRRGFEFMGQLKQDRLSDFVRKSYFKNFLLNIRTIHRLKHGGNLLLFRDKKTS